MKKFMMIVAALFFAAIPARAQDTYPRAEIFGGYSYFSADISIDDPFDDDDAGLFNQREGIHGVGFSVAGNLSRSVGIVGDFSYHKREIEIPGGDDIDFSTFLFLVGPRLTERGNRVEGFVHALVGGVRRKVEDFDSDTNLALGFGGGLDVKVTDNVAIRVFQVDYLPFRERNPFTGDKEWSHNARFQIGATYKW